jgi:uncharacterized CHY-type Zn-finger protein
MSAGFHMALNLPEVRGLNVDSQTRCSRHNKPVDIIAIKMRCCGIYYACKECHIALADHEIEVWPRSEWGQKAILCGACGFELTMDRYLKWASFVQHS